MKRAVLLLLFACLLLGVVAHSALAAESIDIRPVVKSDSSAPFER